MNKEKLKKEFAIKMEDILDEYFPKGKCVERGPALMVFAYAMILLMELMDKYE